MSDDCASVRPGNLRFYDNFVPTLPVGDYLLNVTQRINPRSTAEPIDECYATAQAFSVQAPRYSLPPSDVYSVFPPREAQGAFERFLPHVVLTQPGLPWERNVFGDADTAAQTPWMALLLFVEGERIGGAEALLEPRVEGGAANRTMTATVPIAQLFAAQADGIARPRLARQWYETDEWLQSAQCQVIDVSPQAFAALVPGRRELRYLSHVRQVDPSAKDQAALGVSGDGWYSVLVAGRLPDAPPAGGGQPGRRNIVHLVSLEGLEQYAGGATPLPDGTTRVRMVSLESWTFTCVPDAGESFAALMNGLVRDRQGAPRSTLFTLPVALPPGASAEEDYAAGAIAGGYVPLRWHTRLGEESFAWYRGPFSPVPVRNFVSAAQAAPSAPSPAGPGGTAAPAGSSGLSGPPDDPAAGVRVFDTASSAMIYDGAHGVFDVSYAVAWETGRLMALSDPRFGQELLAWQCAGHRLTDLLLERQAQLAALQHLDAQGQPAGPVDALSLAQPHALTAGFMAYAVSSYASGIGARTGDTPAGDAGTAAYFADRPAPPGGSRGIAAAAGEAQVADALRQAAQDALREVTAWLAQRYLLAGVPFEALVPSAALLPGESVRFFYVDGNWLDALVEGALSIGMHSSRDRMYQGMMKDLVWSGTHAAAAAARASVLASVAPASSGAQAPPAPPVHPEGMAGLLLRSAAVSGWPGLEVHGYSAFTVDGGGVVRPDLETEIRPLRVDCLSGDVLLCLWPRVPAVVTLEEPQEGIAFGFEDPPQGRGEGDWLFLRSLDPSRYGTPCCGDAQMEEGACAHALDAAADGLVDPGTRRLRMDTLLAAVAGKLGADQVRVRDLAVQMVKVPEQAVFAAAPSVTA